MATAPSESCPPEICFEAIPHSGLMAAIEERVSDRHLLKLLRAMLRAG